MSKIKNQNIFRATSHAFNGIRELLQERSAKREVAIVFIAAGIWLYRPDIYTTIILVLSMLLLAVEALNSAIEHLCDYLTKDIHPSIKKIKDLGAAAVFWVVLSIIFTACAAVLDTLELGLQRKAILLALKISEHLSQNVGSYLFYVGTTLISLQYLRQRKWVKAKIVFLAGLLWIAAVNSITGFFGNLGADSFHEAQSFDLKEAQFWLHTFWIQLGFSLHIRTFILYSIIAAGAYFLLRTFFYFFRVTEKQYSYLKFSLGSILIVVALYQSFWSAANLFFKNTESFERVARNFENSVPPVTSNTKLSVLLYIGESTSVMNMGLYGYPRQTTPLLRELERKEKGFMKFENVLSTHTHTSPSLLEALSIEAVVGENLLPIDQRRRVSVVDILDKSGILTELYSNQGATGTWNQASSIIFKNAKRTFSTENRFLGNADYTLDKPWDHHFFMEKITQERLNSNSPSLLVFHSYAGHGSYLKNIPSEFRNPVDDYFKGKSVASVVGSIDDLKSVEEYDSAIRYIDYAVSNSLKTVKESNKPWVFLYLADHGDAVFPNRGHDSSRFIHEMSRVPFVIYFNEAARKVAPELFDKYVGLASKKNVSTLAQLPATLFDLLGVSVSANTTPVVGADISPEPIVVRETKEGITAVNLSSRPFSNSLIDKTDSATAHFVVSRQYSSGGPAICYPRSNTIAKALRGSLVTNCLEIDIMVGDDEKVLAYQPPAENTGLTLEDVLSSVKSNEALSFWFDGKNLTSRKTCNGLRSFLAAQGSRKSQVLIEFPSGSHKAKAEIGDCVEQLKTLGPVFPSYYVPTGHAITCSKAISDGKPFAGEPSCRALEEDLSAAKQSNLFTDISFDYGGIKAIESLPFASSFRWSTWHVKASELGAIKASRFRMIILTNDDPNIM